MTKPQDRDQPGPGIPGKIEHFIGGRHVPSASGATFDVADPVSNTVYAQAAAGDAADIDRAVAAAREAFQSGPWPGLAARARAKILNRIADGIEARGEQIAALETFDTGLPVTQAKGQAARAAENFRYFADVIVAQHEDAFSSPGQLGYVLRRPTGVAGLITPWNTPFMLESWKLAPALASGCTVVLKPAEWTPLSASLLPEIMTEAGVPDGVFNIVHGIGEDAGAALVAHPDVPLISFTGETTTGKIIMKSAADNLKGLSMELGGKSPCVIFADADLDAADRLRAVRCHVAERGAVHGGFTDPGRTGGVRHRRRPPRRAGGPGPRGRPGRSADRDRGAGPPGAPRAGPRLRGHRRQGGRPARRGRVAPGGTSDGELPRGDRVRGREAVDADLPGGDLRSGRLRDAVRHRGGGDRAGQRHEVRAGRLPVDQST